MKKIIITTTIIGLSTITMSYAFDMNFQGMGNMVNGMKQQMQDQFNQGGQGIQMMQNFSGVIMDFKGKMPFSGDMIKMGDQMKGQMMQNFSGVMIDMKQQMPFSGDMMKMGEQMKKNAQEMKEKFEKCNQSVQDAMKAGQDLKTQADQLRTDLQTAIDSGDMQSAKDIKSKLEEIKNNIQKLIPADCQLPKFGSGDQMMGKGPNMQVQPGMMQWNPDMGGSGTNMQQGINMMQQNNMGQGRQQGQMMGQGPKILSKKIVDQLDAKLNAIPTEKKVDTFKALLDKIKTKADALNADTTIDAKKKKLTLGIYMELKTIIENKLNELNNDQDSNNIINDILN